MPDTLGATTVSEPSAPAQARPLFLTRELLESLTEQLITVVSTVEVQDMRLRRPREALLNALKQVDRLWPYAEVASEEAVPQEAPVMRTLQAGQDGVGTEVEAPRAARA